MGNGSVRGACLQSPTIVTTPEPELMGRKSQNLGFSFFPALFAQDPPLFPPAPWTCGQGAGLAPAW